MMLRKYLYASSYVLLVLFAWCEARSWRLRRYSHHDPVLAAPSILESTRSIRERPLKKMHLADF